MNSRDFYKEAKDAIVAIAEEKYGETVTPDDVNIFWAADALDMHRYFGKVTGGSDRIYLVTIEEFTEESFVKVYVPDEAE